MTDLIVHREGRAGRMTLNRPKALNAVTHEMCLGIERALDAWRYDDAVALVLIDGAGERAFSAGGDIAEMYATGTAGNYDYGRRFWRDEYRLNAKLFHYPKPIVTFLHGFTMGGGVGVGCHARHRIVGESAQVAMPECGIGLVPDVGGSLILANAPGHTGEYLALTSARMGAADAIRAGFADVFVPETQWDALKADLCESGSPAAIGEVAERPPVGRLAAQSVEVDRLFGGGSLAAIVEALECDTSDFAADALARVKRNSPLAMACAVEMLKRLRRTTSIGAALMLEYRFTWRAMEGGDFLEGIRAAIIDKDRSPKWRHAAAQDVTEAEVSAMLASLGDAELKLGEGAA